MANLDAPFGFRPVQSDNGSPYIGKLRKYHIAAADAVALFKGDPVVGTNASVTDADGEQVRTVARASVAGQILGVIVDFVPVTDESTSYRSASTAERYVLVNDDPYALFEIQADEDIAAADIGKIADIVFTHAGSTATGFSGCELDSSTIGTTGDVLMIEGVRKAPDGRNEIGSNNTVALVRINRHQKRTTAAT